MGLKAPPVDARSKAEFNAQIQQLLTVYLGGYGWTAGSDGGEAGRALTGICAHYAALVRDRINAAPEKNFLAFLDLLGNSPTPPVPAQVPLTFVLDASARTGRNIPAGSRIQAADQDADGQPITFETDVDLWLSNFELQCLHKWIDGGVERVDLADRIVTAAALAAPTPADDVSGLLPLFDRLETLYIGLDVSPGRALEMGRSVALYFFIDALLYDSTKPEPAPARVIWEYLSGTDALSAWSSLVTEDASQGLTQSGAVHFLVPGDWTKQQVHDIEPALYWLRVYLVSTTPDAVTAAMRRRSDNVSTVSYGNAPRLRALALNTVTARQGVTIKDEILGSSNAMPHQKFTSFRRPILAGQQVDVLERRASGGTTNDADVWTAWSEVADFHGSGPGDRHYLVERETGEIRFGDGLHGMMPPRGTRNLRLARYRSGSGIAGNVEAGAANILVESSRFVAKVGNVVPAMGGAAGETLQPLMERAPRALRHRFRAVTTEDYEDLARLASADVARALCAPLLDLAQNPIDVMKDEADEAAGAGRLSVVIVPRSDRPAPLPSVVLMQQVMQHLRLHGSAAASIAVVGPLYLRVKVSATLKLRSLDLQDRVVHQFTGVLTDWLHPLSGRGGVGWPFGREPHESDIHRLACDIDGVDHVIALRIEVETDVAEAGWAANLSVTDRIAAVRDTGRFLVCSGAHDIQTA